MAEQGRVHGLAVREPSPAQGMNDLLNCGCQILDDDLTTRWMHSPAGLWRQQAMAAQKRSKA